MIINLLPVLENKRPVRLKTVGLDGVFHIVRSGFVEGCSFDVVGDPRSKGQYEVVMLQQRVLGMERDLEVLLGVGLRRVLLFILLPKPLIRAVGVVYPYYRYIAAFGDVVELVGAVNR